MTQNGMTQDGMTRDGGIGGSQWIGILGGGQLGRMLAIAAAQLGLKTHIYAPDADRSPAGEVATRITTAAYDDTSALRDFAAGMNAVTSEFENVPAATMAVIGEFCLAARARPRFMPRSTDRRKDAGRWPWHPNTALLAGSQPAGSHSGDGGAVSAAILKTCRLGYDGKGQRRISPAMIWMRP